MARQGTVYLVGAGPGDPGLLTVRGQELLQAADVVVYDRLANPELLRQARRDAFLIDVGKAPGRQAMSQDAINQTLVEQARQGRMICRLKGGDPFVFGRGGEEALACCEAGVAFEVVPGISSSIAAPAYAGIPVTHRNVATSFTVITGHENPEKADRQVDWGRLANGADTLCILMGVGGVRSITAELIAGGRAPTTPAAAVQWGTRGNQRTVVSTLAGLADAIAAAELSSPAVIVIGEVVGLRDRLSWFERRPLHGRTVVVTRSRTQASGLSERLRRLGAEVLEYPFIRVEPRSVAAELLDRLGPDSKSYDWVVFTSVNAVAILVESLLAAGLDLRSLGPARLAAIGSATADALRSRGLRVDYLPTSFHADQFAAEFPGASAARVLLPCGSKARDVIQDSLTGVGATVDRLNLYDTVLGEADGAELGSRLAGGEVDAITFTSSSTVEHFRAVLPNADLRNVARVSIGPQTSTTLQQHDLPPTIEASTSTIDGLVEAVVAVLARP